MSSLPLPEERVMFSFFILERRVFGCMANLSAAPFSPFIFQLDSSNSFSICSFSICSRETEGSDWEELFFVSPCPHQSNLSVSEVAEITERSITFFNSRILPGHEYSQS